MSLLNPMIASLLKLEQGTNLLVINPLQMALLIIGLMVMAVLSGWLPSRKATKLDPIEALGRNRRIVMIELKNVTKIYGKKKNPICGAK